MSPTMQSQATPTSADACLSIVHSLMFYMQGGEAESFSKKAIESLVKKLKEKRDELDNLITAVTSNGARPTKCVTIPRTLDGRLQGFPHVIYAKIWRWPDLHKNELKQIKDCQFAFDLKQESVCVNPYHYDRVVCPGIDLSGLTIESSVNIDDYSSCKMEGTLGEASHYDSLHQNMMSNLESNLYHHHHHHHHQQQPPSHLHHHFLPQYNPHFPHSLHQHLHPPHPPMGTGAPMVPPSTVSYPLASHPSGTNNLNGNNNINNDNNGSINMSQSSTRDPTMIGNQPNMMGQSDQPSPMEHSASYQNSSLCPAGVAAWNGNNNTNGNNKLRDGMYSDCNTATGKPLSYPQNHHHSNIDKLLVSMLPPPEFWCTITYFELDQQVGETFKVPSSRTKVVVDGYTDTFDPNRICLGMLSNVHRTEISERTRRYIGKGIELTLEGEGDINIRCLSQHPIFIKGAYLDMIAGRAQSKVVHKVHPSIEIRAFDLKWCYHQIQHQTASSLATAVAQAAVVAGNVQGGPGMGALTPAISLSSTAGVSVDELRKLCVLHLSFIKGWGPDYPRLNIKQTPCWVEIQLHRPLQLLDELLQSMPMIGHGDQRRRPGMGVMLP